MPNKIYTPQEGYNIIAPFYDSWSWQHFWKNTEYNFVKEWCDNLPPSLHGLDIGTGSGNNLFCFLEKGHHIDAIDISTHMLDFCKKKHSSYMAMGQLNCFIEDAVNIVRHERVYDWIISNRVFSHIADIRRVANRIKEVIKYNGVFFFSDIHPAYKYDYTNYTLDNNEICIETHKHKLDEIEQTFIACGFEKISDKIIYKRNIKKELINIRSLQRQDPDTPIFFYFIFRYRGNKRKA